MTIAQAHVIIRITLQLGLTMDRQKARKEIYKQAKRLQESYKLPLDSNVYIHWNGNAPIVLPTRTNGYGIVNTIKLEKILTKQLILI